MMLQLDILLIQTILILGKRDHILLIQQVKTNIVMVINVELEHQYNAPIMTMLYEYDINIEYEALLLVPFIHRGLMYLLLLVHGQRYMMDDKQNVILDVK